jgi:membrane associated rhomboid family serine protease
MVPEDHLEHREFLNAVWTRRPLFTYIFFGANIFIFLLMMLAGGSTNDATLMAFGVKHNAMIANGQWWRFVTPIFIHIGFLHLFFNSYALWIVGPQVEKLYGPARFAILYLLTGIAGVYGSYYYHPYTPSAGASGAIFGLFGVLLVFGLRYRDSIPPSFKRAVGTGVLPVILINLFIGFTMSGIVDNAAHLAGLIAGAALAAAIPYQQPGAETPPIFKTLQMVLLALVVVCFFQVARHYDGPQLSLRNLGGAVPRMGGASPTQGFINAINDAQHAFEASVDDIESGKIDHLRSLNNGMSKAIDQLRRIPSLSAASDQLAASLLRVAQDQYELMQDVERSGTVTFAHSRQLKENKQVYDRIMSDISNWVATEGERHGITETR